MEPVKLPYTQMAMVAWSHLRGGLEIVAPPPPLRIDRKHVPRADKRSRYRFAEFVTETVDFHFYDADGNDTGHIIAPTDYKVVLYHKPLESLLRCEFKNQISPNMVRIYIMHLMTHEYLHYVDYLSCYAQAELLGEMADFEDYLYNPDKDPDLETRTELGAIKFMHDAYLSIGELFADEDNQSRGPEIRPVIGGKYDRWMRKHNADYREASIILEYCYMKCFMLYHTSDPLVLGSDKMSHKDILERIFELQEMIMDGQEPDQFVLVD